MLPRLSGSLRSNLRVESLSLQTKTFDIFRLTRPSNCSDIKRLGAKLRHVSLFISLNIDSRVFFLLSPESWNRVFRQTLNGLVLLTSTTSGFSCGVQCEWITNQNASK